MATYHTSCRKKDFQFNQDWKEPRKKRILTEEYGMIMTEELEGRMQNVCSWSEYFIEEGLKEGREEGIKAFVLDNLEGRFPEGVFWRSCSAGQQGGRPCIL